jgi:HNH endonuclease
MTFRQIDRLDYRIQGEICLISAEIVALAVNREGPMPASKGRRGNDTLDRILADARHDRERRGNVYRDQALKILPWICAWCGREFSGKKLHELTVHHKDRNHNNNPPDGSNWELLCLYCHDSEHSRSLDQTAYGGSVPEGETEAPSTYKAFADLKSLLKVKK